MLLSNAESKCYYLMLKVNVLPFKKHLLSPAGSNAYNFIDIPTADSTSWFDHFISICYLLLIVNVWSFYKYLLSTADS